MADNFNWDDHEDAYGAPKGNEKSFNWDSFEDDGKVNGKEPGLIQNILETVDSYTGAPTRSAIGAAINGNNPISSFVDHFGSDPKTAPTGEDIAKKIGVSNKRLFGDSQTTIPPTDPLSAMNFAAKKILGKGIEDIPRDKLLGMGIDVAADWTNAIPAIPLIKKALSPTTKVVGEGVGSAASFIGRNTKEIAEAIAPKTVSALDAIGSSMKGAYEALGKTFTPEVRPQFVKDVEVAIRNGLDPSLLSESHKYGPNSFITQATKAKTEGVLGEPLRMQQEKAFSAVRDAIDNNIVKIGSNKPVLDPTSAGELLRDSYNKEVRKFFDSMDVTFDRITDRDVASGLMINRNEIPKINSKLNGIEKWAKGQSTRGFTDADRAQATQVLRAVQAVREGNGSFKQTKETLRQIGEVAFGTPKGHDVPPDIAKFQDLYHTIKDALIETVRKDVSPQFAEELIQNNAAMTNFFKKNDHISKVLNDGKSPGEKIFNDLILSGNTEKIRSLKSIIKDPETLNRLKAAFLENSKTYNPDGAFSFNSFSTKLHNDDKMNRVLKELFDPDEINNFRDLVKLGVDFGGPINPSGTGKMIGLQNLKSSVYDGAISSGIVDNLKNNAHSGYLKTIENTPETEKIRNLLEGYRSVKPENKYTKTLNAYRELDPTGRKTISTWNVNDALMGNSSSSQKMLGESKNDENRVPSNEKLIPENEARQMFLKGN